MITKMIFFTMNMFNQFHHKWLALGGFFIISLTFYNKFLKPRLTGPIDFIYSEYKFYFYIIMIISFSIALILLCIFPIYRFFMLKFFKKQKASETPIKEPFYAKIHLLIIPRIKSLRELYERMIEAFYLPLVEDSFLKYDIYWDIFVISVNNLAPYFRFILNLFFFLPPCLISFCYLWETIKHEYTYFPYVVFLMAFPILIRVCLYNAQLYCNRDEIAFNGVLFKEEGVHDYIWVLYSSIPEDERTTENIKHLSKLKEANLNRIELFEEYRKFLYTLPERIYYTTFSVTCWLLSFSYMLYKIL